MPKRKLSVCKGTERNLKKQKVQTSLLDLPENVLVKILLLDCHRSGFTLISRLIKHRQVCQRMLAVSSSKSLWKIVNFDHGLADRTVRDVIVHFMASLGSHTQGIALNGHAGRTTQIKLNEMFEHNPLRSIQLSRSNSNFDSQFFKRTLKRTGVAASIQKLSVKDCKISGANYISKFLRSPQGEVLNELHIDHVRNVQGPSGSCMIHDIDFSKWTCKQTLTRLELHSAGQSTIRLEAFCASTPNLRTLIYHGVVFWNPTQCDDGSMLQAADRCYWQYLTTLELSFFRRLPKVEIGHETRRAGPLVDYAVQAGKWMSERTPALRSMALSTNTEPNHLPDEQLRSSWVCGFSLAFLNNMVTSDLTSLKLARLRAIGQFDKVDNGTIWQTIQELSLERIDVDAQNLLLHGVRHVPECPKLEKLSITRTKDISDVFWSLGQKSPNLCRKGLQVEQKRVTVHKKNTGIDLTKPLGAVNK